MTSALFLVSQEEGDGKDVGELKMDGGTDVMRDAVEGKKTGYHMIIKAGRIWHKLLLLPEISIQHKYSFNTRLTLHYPILSCIPIVLIFAQHFIPRHLGMVTLDSRRKRTPISLLLSAVLG